MNIILYFSTLVTLFVFDAIWLFSTAAYYKTRLGHLFATSPQFLPAVLFYLLYAGGLLYFVISPALQGGFSWKRTVLSAAFFGIVAYATYDLTNNATLKDWPVIITVLDIVWGASLAVITTVIVITLYRHFK